MCSNLFKAAKGKLNCPIRIYPLCHPKAHFDVFVVGSRREIILSCSQCDQTFSTIKTISHETKPGNHRSGSAGH